MTIRSVSPVSEAQLPSKDGGVLGLEPMQPCLMHCYKALGIKRTELVKILLIVECRAVLNDFP